LGNVGDGGMTPPEADPDVRPLRHLGDSAADSALEASRFDG
jgi:hypothetical protein